MRKIYRKKYAQTAGVVVLVFLFLAVLLFSVYGWRQWKFCMEENRAMEQKLQSMGQMLYVAARNLPKGVVLTEEDVVREVRYTDSLREWYIGEEDFGKMLVADVQEGICLMDSMLVTTKEHQREVFVSEICMAEYLEESDRIDVRICYGNGEDYVVLADKVIVSIDRNQGMVLCMTEEEILMLASAIADEKNYEDVQLYAVKYPKQGQSVSSFVSYIPRKEILALLKKESTEGESRTALEYRLLQDEKR